MLDRTENTAERAARTPARTVLALIMLCGALSANLGCSSIRVTDPSRTASEQFLLSTAAVKAVEQLTFEALRGRKVFVDSTHFAPSEQAFVLAEIRAKCLQDGVQLMPKRDDAQIVLELRSGGVGIDRKEFLLGVPPLLLSGQADGNVGSTIPILTPEFAFLKNIEQKGYANVVYVAYWAASGEILASSPSAMGRTLRDDWWFFGFGPRTVGNIPTVEQEQE